MTTELKRFTEAYATMTVAAYEPLILRWVSLLGIRFISNAAASRLPKAAAVKFDGRTPAALALSKTVRKAVPSSIDFKYDGGDLRVPIDVHGRAVSPEGVTKVNVPGYPDAVAIGKDVYLKGFSATDPAELLKGQTTARGGGGPAVARMLSHLAARAGSVMQGLKTIPLSVAGRLGVRSPTFDFTATRDALQENMTKAAQDWAKDPDGKDLGQLMKGSLAYNNVLLPHMWPLSMSIHEALSPIGIAHYYRQLYFHKEEGVGPIEEAFTVAPLETLEVIYQTVRKQVHEEVLEQGLEVVSESAVEEKNLDEVSDKVSSMVQQDVSASMSATASEGVGV